MHPERPLNSENLETQIAIVGGGGAGLAAAVAAAEKGAGVIVLEKRETLGGNSLMAEGLLAAESPVQKRVKIDATGDELFRIAMNYAHWALNARLVRAFIDKSGDTIRWLEAKGLKFEVLPLYPNQVPMVWHCMEGGGAATVKALVRDCEKYGVRLLRKTGAKKLMTDQQGHLSGVIAVASDRELNIRAGSVIIATGGYGGNKELLRKYCPFYTEDMFCRGLSHMGDGLLMAAEIGAATEGLGILQVTGPNFRGSLDAMVIAQEPDTIWVNRKGERFIDEATGFNHWESVNALIRQPGKISFTLLDEKIKQRVIREGIIKGWGLRVLSQTRLTDLENKLHLEVNNGTVRISDDWDGIAGWIGASPEVLKATVDEYNACCDNGHDDVFAKDRRYLEALRTPPYYALRCYPSFPSTIGGIKINHRMEVLDREDDPIPGLYAAGVDTGGWETVTYNAILSGSTYGFAINSGRIAGENAADYVL
jgi:fumarate reductase flavoprotein subunit